MISTLTQDLAEEGSLNGLERPLNSVWIAQSFGERQTFITNYSRKGSLTEMLSEGYQKVLEENAYVLSIVYGRSLIKPTFPNYQPRTPSTR